MRTRIIAALVAVCAVTAFAYLWADRSKTEIEVVAPPPAVRSGRPTTVQIANTFSGSLLVEVGDSLTVKAPVWRGLVTSVEVAPGDIVSDGSEIATIDGVVRKLAATSTPFYRPLAQGNRGADVEQLQELLVRWGYLKQLPADPSWFHWRSTGAVRSLAHEAGVDPATGVFDPGWVLWAPTSDEIIVVRSPLRVGDGAPSPGTAVVESISAIDNYSLESSSDDTPAHLEGKWVIKIAEEGLRGIEILSDDNIIEHEALAELLQMAESNGDFGLTLGTVYDFAVSAESVRSRELLSVPVTSLRTSIDGSTSCVFLRASESDSWTATLVSPVDSPGSNVIVDLLPELEDRDVLFNPSAVLENPFCP